MNAASLESLKDFGAAICAKLVGDSLERKSFPIETDCGLKIEAESGLSMFEGMLLGADYFKIGETIVLGNAVSMMDVFVSSKLTSDVSLHDETMFVDKRSVGK